MLDLQMISPLTGEKLSYESPEDIEYYSELQDAVIGMRQRTCQDPIHRDISALTMDERKLFGGYVHSTPIDGARKRG
jgi:hypothetical protein